MRTDEIRSRFLRFFESRGHKRVRSASLIPGDDPTVLFTPAGMNQFKEKFLGIGLEEYTRATSCQKCLRTGDIDRVGRTPAHMTFFEMLGNFSFGDYFKEEAIQWAWELLTKELSVPPERLSVSVYEEDAEAERIWLEGIGLPRERVQRFGPGDNFWPPNVQTEGPNGPCGPCSEIFYDRGAEHGCGQPSCNLNCDCRRFIEVWNLVFTQFDRKADGTLTPLPRKNIDTGMGLERLASLLQGKSTVFENDIFVPILDAIADLAGTPYEPASERGARFRRIADHARAVVLCLSDGILPTNEGRGYVERRLIRRALRDGMQLGLEVPFLFQLVPAVVERMAGGYPELREMQPRIASTLRAEEERFREALRVGLEKLQDAVKRMESTGGKVLAGPDLFRLYDTYGLPIDVITDVLREKGLDGDIAGFERELEEQRKTARGANPMTGDIFAAGSWSVFAPFATSTKFVGYEKESCEAKVLAIARGHKGGELLKEAGAGTEAAVLLDKTPFYAEGGGQVGDTGRLRWKEGEARVLDTQRAGDLILHLVKVESGSLVAGKKATAEIDRIRRASIRRHHTATHLLHAALREVLGPQATQAGSLVAPDRLRFDFHHDKPLAPEQVARVESLMQEVVLEDLPAKAAELPLEEAKKRGAVSLFGEKYGDVVRMLEIGKFSMELCGGTHVSRTGQIGPVVIVSQSSVSSGIRRIEAVAGFAAYRAIEEERETLRRLSDLLGSPVKELSRKAEAVLAAQRKLQKDLERSRTQGSALSLDDLVAKAEVRNGSRLVASVLPGDAGVNDLRILLDRLKPKLADGAAVLGGRSEGRCDVVVYVAPGLVAKGLSAAEAAKAAAAILGGGGGGKPESAQAGGKEIARLDEAVKAALSALSAKLG